MDQALADLDDEARALGVLLTSEVVTNALVHALAPLSVRVLLGHDAVRVEVIDRSEEMPVRLPSTPEDVQGRGLVVVEALSAQWGAERLQGGGKTVWFELAVPRRAS